MEFGVPIWVWVEAHGNAIVIVQVSGCYERKLRLSIFAFWKAGNKAILFCCCKAFVLWILLLVWEREYDSQPCYKKGLTARVIALSRSRNTRLRLMISSKSYRLTGKILYSKRDLHAWYELVSIGIIHSFCHSTYIVSLERLRAVEKSMQFFQENNGRHWLKSFP